MQHRKPYILWLLYIIVLLVSSATGSAHRSVRGKAALPPGPVDPVTVFHLGEAGYFCMKIPYILTTSQGTLLAFAEARKPTCSDYTWTDLVVKRSVDNGFSWSALKVVYSNSTAEAPVVIGNAAPIQDRDTGRIVLPFCRNNSQVLLSFSDDDGLTWTHPRNITSSVVQHGWNWVGLGPPSGIQLASGRLLVPAYHGPFHWDDGTFTHPHTIYSDDHGDTWHIGFVFNHTTDPSWGNECQAAELQNNTVLLNARDLTFSREQAYSSNGGLSFTSMKPMANMPQPLDGVEGSLVKHPPTEWLFFSNPHEDSVVALRFNMTLQVSKDYGRTWQVIRVIDSGPSGYSALTVTPQQNIGMLYERSNETKLIFLPQNISYQVVWMYG